MKALSQYVDQQNRFSKIFGAPQIKLDFLTVGAKQELLDRLECDLSPENLTCDGEIRGAAVVKKAKFLRQVVSELQALKAV